MLANTLLGEPIIAGGQKDNHLLDTNFLALRPGENIAISESMPTDLEVWHRLYRVALIPTPNLSQSDNHHLVNRSAAVICGELYRLYGNDNLRWGWTHLEQSTKRAIGYDLEDFGAVLNVWYWMIIDTRQQRPD